MTAEEESSVQTVRPSVFGADFTPLGFYTEKKYKKCAPPGRARVSRCGPEMMGAGHYEASYRALLP